MTTYGSTNAERKGEGKVRSLDSGIQDQSVTPFIVRANSFMKRCRRGEGVDGDATKARASANAGRVESSKAIIIGYLDWNMGPLMVINWNRSRRVMAGYPSIFIICVRGWCKGAVIKIGVSCDEDEP